MRIVAVVAFLGLAACLLGAASALNDPPGFLIDSFDRLFQQALTEQPKTAAAAAAARPSSFFDEGGKEIIRATLRLDTALTCPYGVEVFDYLTCAADPHDQDHDEPRHFAGSKHLLGGSAVAWCNVGSVTEYPTPGSTNNLPSVFDTWQGQFVAVCNIGSDAKCGSHSLGCDNLKVLVHGQSIRTLKAALLSAPSKIAPPIQPDCRAGFRRVSEAPPARSGAAPSHPKPAAAAATAARAASYRDSDRDDYYYGPEAAAPLPPTVWVPNPASGDNYYGGLKVYSGYMEVVDRRAGRKVADGWWEFTLPVVQYGGDGKPTDNAWTPMNSTDLTGDYAVFRNPWQYEFEFWKERKYEDRY